MENKGKISEVFSSIQGEGAYAGIRQIFVRLYGCNLNCKFCDTKLSTYEKYSATVAYDIIKRFNTPHHSICFTGGEPLLQKDFLKTILGFIRHDGISSYLETNGTLPDALEDVIDDVDTIAMDFKLPTSTGMKDFWKEHTEFLKIAAKKNVFVKSVICLSTQKEDFQKAVSIIAKIDRKILFILQPNFYEMSKSLLDKIRDFQKMALEQLDDVRLIPQLHKMIGVR